MSEEKTEAVLMSKVERLRMKTFATISEALLSHREEIEAMGAETCGGCIDRERNGMLDATSMLFVGPTPGPFDRIVEAFGKALATPEFAEVAQRAIEAFGGKANPGHLVGTPAGVVTETPIPTEGLTDEALVDLHGRMHDKAAGLFADFQNAKVRYVALETEIARRGLTAPPG